MAHTEASRSFRGARVTTGATHRFPIGAKVRHSSGLPSSEGVYEVTRHMPDGGFGLQYRLRCVSDGRERVATEATLTRAEAGLG